MSSFITPDNPALILAPMEGVTDAPMRALQGETGAFSFAVSEFLRIAHAIPPRHVFLKHIPELNANALTPSGLPVQVQLLGGDPALMAASAVVACSLGARAIDINFGCPARTVNRNDGGATLLKHPTRIRDIVRAVRNAVTPDIPVSAKVRLGWDCVESIHDNAEMAVEGGASWLTIHARTRTQGYAPPVYWSLVGRTRERLPIPVVANGDIWNMEDFRRCREESGCRHFMLGRGALANPVLAQQIARELGMAKGSSWAAADWPTRLMRLQSWSKHFGQDTPDRVLHRMKQWLRLASTFGAYDRFEISKRARTLEELFAGLPAAA